MSMVLTRSPLEPIGMNGAGTSKRRSARLSHEGAEENEPPTKKSRANGAHTVATKEQDGDSNAVSKKRQRKTYDEHVDDFSFTKGGRKAKEAKKPAVRTSGPEKEYPTPPSPAAAPPAKEMPPPPKPQSAPASAPAPAEEPVPKTTAKKPRRRFPTTPEREAAEKPIRRSKRLSNENTGSDPASPTRPAHARSHANTERSPSPEKARPVTVEKKRKRGANGVEEEEKIMRIALPFQDTPVIRRNKEMRKSSADGQRRSSSGMRGRRASSLINEGRGNEASAMPVQFNSFGPIGESVSRSPPPPPSESTSPVETLHNGIQMNTQETQADKTFLDAALPHAEVPTAEFFKHISAELTENRRMRCLLGWCGTRSLPPKPDAPEESTPASSLEFQALQAARVIQEELSQDLITKGTLSDWFSRDYAVAPQIPLRKKPNPRNITNAAKLEELERELERLKMERADWDALMEAAAVHLPASPTKAGAGPDSQVMSPLHLEVMDSPDREILEQLQAPSTEGSTEPEAVQQRLRNATEHLEFSVDQFAHGVHAIYTLEQTGERLAERTLGEAAGVLEERENARRLNGKGGDALDALKALGKVMNGKRR